jgi:hypothetical protein
MFTVFYPFSGSRLFCHRLAALRIEVVVIDELSALYTLQIIPLNTNQDVSGAKQLAVDVRAMQLGGDRSLGAFFSNLDEFMNRLGLMLCFDPVRWQQVERLLSRQGRVSIAGRDAELAFTELELKELGLEEDVRRAA